MTAAGTFRIEYDHPSLPGHFPGRPIVPGVVLIDHAVALIALHAAGQELAGVPVVKLIRPVLPGEDVRVGFRDQGDGRIAFRCDVDGAASVTGTLQFDRRPG